MTRRTNRQTVPFTAQQMYALVADIERYPEFIPYCTGLRILKRTDVSGGEDLTAQMRVQYKVFREQFTCKVQLRPDELKIRADYIDGPVKKLETFWAFDEQAALEEKTSEIDFLIDFEFGNILMQKASDAVFDKAFVRMSDAFVARAHAVYT